MSDPLSQVIRRFEGFLLGDDQDYIEARRKAGQYNYVPFSEDVFLKQLNMIRMLSQAQGRERKLRFVDVGCGLGTKLFLALSSLPTSCFGKICGIEVDKKYVDLARKLTSISNVNFGFQISGKDRFEIIHADALTVSYRPFDVIYFYCPLVDIKKQMMLEERIVRTARRGALFLPNLAQHSKLWKSDKVKLLVDDDYSRVYQKV